MKAPYLVTSGGFDAGVVPPGPLREPVPDPGTTTRQPLPDEYMNQLSQMLMAEFFTRPRSASSTNSSSLAWS